MELAACYSSVMCEIIPVHVRMEVLRVPYSYSDVCMCVCVCRMELAGLEYKWEACSRDPMLPLSLSWMVSPQVCDSTINTIIIFYGSFTYRSNRVSLREKVYCRPGI